ncbi:MULTISPECIES: hypothetical protein [Bacillus]|uniref:hypothetical protein n=1 Tax=Bacillus TaxID=1386 RepID=UPI000BEE68E4|nr:MULTISPECIES: hypothetical protein [Bacillus]PED46823.1 hypothetical protein CON49_26520 [Bacillus cereus]PFI65713.1 hypothetical protein COI82_23465 [Bacillus cereus]PFO52986.1 hypothetical protein COJ74_24730 [Bacillus cereus]PFP65439.1 hypothetical protein COJ99_26550 [Bacillus cereus]PFQ20581.1 hypothetical protein COK13_19185 [Bacillus cereus]
MTKAIFTKGTCKKYELFDTFVQVALNGGWKLRDGTNLTDTTIDLYTNGYNEDKHLAIRINCLDGNYSGCNIRTTNYSDGSIVMGAIEQNGNFTTQEGFNTLCFFPGRSYSDFSTSGARSYDRLFDMEYYYYVDKEVIVFLVTPFRYTNLGNTLIFIGFPEESFVEESRKEEKKPYSGAIYANSGHSGSDTGQYSARITETPKNLLPLPTRTTMAQRTLSLVSPLSPNVDNKFVLSEIFYGDSNTGLRGRFGRIYLLSPGGMLDGDIIEIKVENKIQKYRYTALGGASNNYTSFITNAVAIRVE